MLNDNEYIDFKELVVEAILNAWHYDRETGVQVANSRPIMVRSMLYIGYKEHYKNTAIIDLAASVILYYFRNTAIKTISAELDAMDEFSAMPIPTQLQNAIDRLSESTYPDLGEPDEPPQAV